MRGQKGAVRRRARLGRQLRLRYFFLPVVTFASMGFIFPGVVLLARKFGSPKPGEIAACSNFSFEFAGVALLVLALVTIAWPFAFRMLNSALYLMAWAFPWAGTTGLWFYLCGIGIVLCTPLRYPPMLLLITNVFFFAFTIVAFWFFLRPRLPVALRLNAQKWDFEKMQYSILAPLATRRPVDGKEPGALARSGLIAFVAIMTAYLLTRWLFDLILTRYMPPASARDWQDATFLMAGGYVTLFMALGQGYAMYLVHRQCKAVGAKMRIKEFSQ